MTTSHDDETTSSNGAGDDGGKPDIDQLQSDIEQTRAELGETVEALTAKLDVKSRAKARVADTRQKAMGQIKQVQDKATTTDGKPTPVVLGGAGSVVAVIVLITGLVLWRKKR